MVNNPTRANDVFISYSRRNSDFVERLGAALDAAGVGRWVDKEDIPLSAEWWAEIRKGIEAANVFVFIISPDSLRSEVCNWEMGYAERQGKKIVPVLYQDVFHDGTLSAIADLRWQTPDGETVVAEHNWAILQARNFVLMDDFAAGVEGLIMAVRTDLEHVEMHTRLLVRARLWEDRQRDNDYLLRGQELVGAENWFAVAHDEDPPPTDLHGHYIQSSRRAASQRLRVMLGATTAALAVTVALTIVSLLLFREADHQRGVAEDAAATAIAERDRSESLRLAAEATNLLSDPTGLPETAALLALQALRITTTERAELVLLAALEALPPGPPFDQHEVAVTVVRLAPDGTLALSGDEWGTIYLWDVASREVIHTLAGHDGIIVEARFNAAGDEVLTADDTGLVISWDVASGERLVTSETGRDINALDLTPDNSRLLVGWGDGAMVVDVDSGALVRQFDWSDYTAHAVITPDGQYVLRGDLLEPEATVYEVTTGDAVRTLRGESDGVSMLALSPDGRLAASGGFLGLIDLWDLERGTHVGVLEGHTEYVTEVAFSPDGRFLLSASLMGDVFVWDLERRVQVQALMAHTDSALGVAYGAATILSAGQDGAVWVWPLERPPTPLLLRHPDAATGIELTPDGSRLVTASWDGKLRVWDMASETVVQTVETPADWLGFADLWQGLVVTGGGSDATYIVDLETGQVIRELFGGFLSITQAAFAYDGALVAGTDTYGTVYLWDAASGEVVHYWEGQSPAPDQLDVVAWSPVAPVFVVASSSGEVRLYDAEARALLQSISLESSTLFAARWMPDGSRLAVGGTDGARLLDGTTLETLVTYQGHTAAVSGLAFGPDTLLTGSLDRTLALWDLASGQRRRTWAGHDQQVAEVDFDPAGRYVLSSSYDGTVRRWYLDTDVLVTLVCERLSRDLTAAERVRHNIASAAPTCER